MSEILDLDADFTTQMLGLAQQAEDRVATTRRPGEAGHPSLSEVLRPLMVGLQAVGRATGENTQLLLKLERGITEPSTGDGKNLASVVSELQTMLDQRNGVSRQMFDALHEELRSYKDGFLLDTVHRPMIRDLITLYDDLTEIHRQMSAAVEEQARLTEGVGTGVLVIERLRAIDLHLEHNREFITEVLARLEVTPLPRGTGRLDKRAQRAVALEATEDPSQDGCVARTVKRGFLWKERVVRPEEVVVKKWKDAPSPEPPRA